MFLACSGTVYEGLRHCRRFATSFASSYLPLLHVGHTSDSRSFLLHLSCYNVLEHILKDHYGCRLLQTPRDREGCIGRRNQEGVQEDGALEVLLRFHSADHSPQALKWHPDRNKNSGEATKKFKEVCMLFSAFPHHVDPFHSADIRGL